MLGKFLLQKIKASDLSIRRIASDSGVDKGTLSRFTTGKASLNLSSVESLMNYFGLVVIEKEDK